LNRFVGWMTELVRHRAPVLAPDRRYAH